MSCWSGYAKERRTSTSGLDGATIRELIERLATIARISGDGLGPFTRDDFARAFTEVCDYAPQLGSDVALLRLPGIGNPSADDETRSFIDQDLADAARAGDVARFVIDPFNAANSRVLAVQAGLGDIGASVAAVKLARLNVGIGLFATALEKVRASGASENGCLGPDIFKVAQVAGIALNSQPITIIGAYCDEIELSIGDPDMSSVFLRDCVIQSLAIESEIDARDLPVFQNCMIGFLQGRTSASDLPAKNFDRCVIEEYSAWIPTTSALMHLDVAPGLRVLLSILKKLFLQSGRGRQYPLSTGELISASANLFRKSCSWLRQRVWPLRRRWQVRSYGSPSERKVRELEESWHLQMRVPISWWRGVGRWPKCRTMARYNLSVA